LQQLQSEDAELEATNNGAISVADCSKAPVNSHCGDPTNQSWMWVQASGPPDLTQTDREAALLLLREAQARLWRITPENGLPRA